MFLESPFIFPLKLFPYNLFIYIFIQNMIKKTMNHSCNLIIFMFLDFLLIPLKFNIIHIIY